MDIPEGVKLYEHTTATFWFGEDGILHSISKPTPRDIPIMTDYIEFIKKITGGKKVCIISDISKATPMDKETREFMQGKMSEIFKAMAIVSHSALGTMVGNIFFKINTVTFPTQQFSNEEDAMKWLLLYL